MLGAAGVMAGVALALAIGFAINHSGMTWVPPGRVTRVPLAVTLWGNWLLLLQSGLLLLLVAVGSAWVPARRASRKSIVETLRHV